MAKISMSYGVSYPEVPGEPGSPWTKINVDIQEIDVSEGEEKVKTQLEDIRKNYPQVAVTCEKIMASLIEHLEDEE